MNKAAFKYIRYILTAIALIVLVAYIANNYQKIHIVDHRFILIAGVLPLLIIPLIVNNRWKYFLSLHDVYESVFDLAKINFISIFYGLVLPSSQGYDAIRILIIENLHPEKRGKVGSSVILERVIGIISLCLMALISVLFMPKSLHTGTIYTVVIFGSVAIIALALIAVSKFIYDILNRFLYSRKLKTKYFEMAVQYLRQLHESLVSTFSLRVFSKSIIYITLFQLATITNVYLVFLSFGVDLPFATHLAIMPIVYIVSMIPVSISGFGIREGAFALFYGSVGIEGPQAVMASILNYSILALIPALIGFVLTLLPRNRSRFDTTNIHQ